MTPDVGPLRSTLNSISELRARPECRRRCCAGAARTAPYTLIESACCASGPDVSGVIFTLVFSVRSVGFSLTARLFLQIGLGSAR